jgi:monoamine oxidase
MNRKEFLRKIIFSLPAAAALQTPFSSCRENANLMESQNLTQSYKGVVLIIGAGISGVVAAKSLKRVGLEPVILEASYKIGGRIKTEQKNGMILEYGASTIHGSSTNPITQIARDAGANLLNFSMDGSYVYDEKGVLIPNEKVNEYKINYNTLLQLIKSNAAQNKSVTDVLNGIDPRYLNDLLMRFLFTTQLESNAGASIDRLSSLYCDDNEKFSGEDLVVINGFDNVINYLSSGLTILTNYEVNRINYKDSKIIVSTQRGEFSAEHVLVTVPLGVLQSQKISFDPLLPSQKAEAIMRLKMSANEKLTMKYNSLVYEHPGYAFGITSAQFGKFNYFLNMNKYSTNNAFTSFLLGNYGETLGGYDGYSYANWANENIWNIFHTAKYGASYCYGTQWKRDPYFYGAFSYVPVSAYASDYDVIAENIDKKLFFAGEHTNRQYRGTVHGAYLSGIRAAEKIIASIT